VQQVRADLLRPASCPVPRESRRDVPRLVSADETPVPAAGKATSASGDGAVIDEGRSLFNIHCSHCHAPNAVNPDPRTDLRRLRRRYGEDMPRVSTRRSPKAGPPTACRRGRRRWARRPSARSWPSWSRCSESPDHTHGPRGTSWSRRTWGKLQAVAGTIFPCPGTG